MSKRRAKSRAEDTKIKDAVAPFIVLGLAFVALVLVVHVMAWWTGGVP